MQPTTSQHTSLLGLCFFIFMLMFAIGIANPIVPLYASKLGASWLDLGLLGTVWGTALMLLGMLSGRLSDRYGRKPLLVASGIFSAVVAFLYLASSTVLQVILIRMLEGAVWALFWPTVEALTTEIVEPRAAGRAMGMATASYGVAFATSSLAGGYVTSILGYSGTFTVYLAISLISIVAAILLFHGSGPQDPTALSSEREVTLDRSSLRSPTVLVAYGLGGAYTFGFGMIITIFPVFAKTLGVTVFLIGVLFGCFWLGRIVGSFGGGRLSDNLGRGSVVALSMFGSAVGFVVVAFSTGIELLLGGIVVLGLSIGAIFPAVVALISDEVSQSTRGYAMGTFEATCAVGFLSAAMLGGIISDLYSPRAPYLLAATICFGSMMVFLAKRPKRPLSARLEGKM